MTLLTEREFKERYAPVPDHEKNLVPGLEIKRYSSPGQKPTKYCAVYEIPVKETIFHRLPFDQIRNTIDHALSESPMLQAYGAALLIRKDPSGTNRLVCEIPMAEIPGRDHLAPIRSAADRARQILEGWAPGWKDPVTIYKNPEERTGSLYVWSARETSACLWNAGFLELEKSADGKPMFVEWNGMPCAIISVTCGNLSGRPADIRAMFLENFAWCFLESAMPYTVTGEGRYRLACFITDPGTEKASPEITLAISAAVPADDAEKAVNLFLSSTRYLSEPSMGEDLECNLKKFLETKTPILEIRDPSDSRLCYWYGQAGDRMYPHGHDAPPDAVRDVFKYLWGEDHGCPCYVAEVNGRACAVLEAEFDTLEKGNLSPEEIWNSLKDAAVELWSGCADIRQNGCGFILCGPEIEDHTASLYMYVPGTTETSQFQKITDGFCKTSDSIYDRHVQQNSGCLILSHEATKKRIQYWERPASESGGYEKPVCRIGTFDDQPVIFARKKFPQTMAENCHGHITRLAGTMEHIADENPCIRKAKAFFLLDRDTTGGQKSTAVMAIPVETNADLLEECLETFRRYMEETPAPDNWMTTAMAAMGMTEKERLKLFGCADLESIGARYAPEILKLMIEDAWKENTVPTVPPLQECIQDLRQSGYFKTGGEDDA